MTIRFATNTDTIRIIRAIQNKHMDYNTPADVREDIKNGCLLVAEENGKLLGSVAVFYKPHRQYHAITRMCVYSKKSQGKGVASALIDSVLALDFDTLGATPWDENPCMCHILEKRGFVYQYTFNTHYKFYKKTA
jgi:RimJ/RimL family protein N-acetyltransferase